MRKTDEKLWKNRKNLQKNEFCRKPILLFFSCNSKRKNRRDFKCLPNIYISKIVRRDATTKIF